MTAPTLYYRFDLDKTYLETPFEDRMAMLRVPFEQPEQKQTLPGMAALVRGIKQHPGPRAVHAHVTILSASPTFMLDRIHAKLALDQVEVDHLVLKDQWRLVRRGRFKEAADPFAYKLHALCTLGADIAPPHAEILIGDDWDLDPLIYTLYAELRAGTLPTDVWLAFLDRHNVRAEVREDLEVRAAQLRGQPSVARVLIRREKRRGPEYYAAFGSCIQVYDDAFQLALLLYDAEAMSLDGVRAVVDELKGRRWRNTAFAFSWRSLEAEHFLVHYREIRDFLDSLDVLPPRRLLERLMVRPPAAPPTKRAPDWDTLRHLTRPGAGIIPR